MNNQKGSATVILLVVLVVVLAGVLVYFAFLKKPGEVAVSPTPTVTKTATPTPAPQISFDGCGKIDKYKNESWYSNFIKNLSGNNISTNTIAETCLSLNKTMFLAITNGSYCTAGSIYKYDVSADTLVKATFNDKGRGCVSWPAEFGKRNGNIITLQGSGSDAGCSNTMYYSYNFIENKIELKQEYGICEGDKTGTWHNY